MLYRGKFHGSPGYDRIALTRWLVASAARKANLMSVAGRGARHKASGGKTFHTKDTKGSRRLVVRDERTQPNRVHIAWSLLAAEHDLGDGRQLHVRGSLVDLSDLAIAEILLDGIILGKPEAAVDLDRQRADTFSDLRGEQLGHRRSFDELH